MTIESRPIPDRNGYVAQSDGVIIGKRGAPLRQALTGSGYLCFRYSEPGKTGLTVSSHVAICEAFHGRRPLGMEVAHGNGISIDNRAANLSWKTPSQNNADKVAHGTNGEGERHGLAKLTENDVRAIRASDQSQVSLARYYGVSGPTIHRVIRRKSWRCVP